jgi:hypothetical protein
VSTAISEELQPTLDPRLTRYRGLLYFVASRVLNGREGAEEAVDNCLSIAAVAAPPFESEGARGSWLLRLVIDEALCILYREKCQAVSAGARQ